MVSTWLQIPVNVPSFAVDGEFARAPAGSTELQIFLNGPAMKVPEVVRGIRTRTHKVRLTLWRSVVYKKKTGCGRWHTASVAEPTEIVTNMKRKNKLFEGTLRTQESSNLREESAPKNPVAGPRWVQRRNSITAANRRASTEQKMMRTRSRQR